ncbi:MAG: ribbon-helix-helix protein, CopG family [Candidatus Aenigmatarchaeota archaeon]
MKRRVTIVLDDELWKEFKIRAIKEDKSYSELIEELMKNKLKK